MSLRLHGRLLLAPLLIGGCASPPKPQTALEYLSFSRDALDADNPERARYLLENVDEASFKGEDLARYKVLLAETYYRLGDWFDAFEVLKEFPRKFPTSDYLRRAEEIQFRAGADLAASGWTFLGLVSDIDDARKVLEHFIVYYPRSERLPDALYLLGEAAYQTEDYELAIERYSQLAQRRPDSAWSDKAAFRIAMSHFKTLEGPEYDRGAMERARRELAGYLQSETTNEAFLSEARQALATTIEWLELKELHVARFYLTVGRPRGARQRLERILAKPDPLFPEEARRLLTQAEQMERAQPEPPAPDEPETKK